MTIRVIRKDEYTEHIQQVKRTVSEIFPILCFMPDEIEAFIRKFETPYNDTIYLSEQANGQKAFIRTLINNYGMESVKYIIRCDLYNRYKIVREAIKEIKTEFIKGDLNREIVITINEKVPSHNAYYAGILPELGFDMQPRVTMTASQELIEQLNIPDLPKDIYEIPFSKDRLSEFIDLYNTAYAVYEDGFSLLKLAHTREFRKWQLTDAQEKEDAVNTWIGLEVKGKIIGSCYGRIWNNEMSLEELAILPDFYGKGIGRFLAIRCMQKLKQHCGEQNRYFFIGTNRTYKRAMQLYQRLGFKIDEFQTYATFMKNDGIQPPT